MDLVVGRVAKAHGVRGELVVDVRTDDPELRFARGVVLRGLRPKRRGAAAEPEQSFTVTAARAHAGRLLLSLAEVGDRSSADALRGLLFVIDAADVDSADDPDGFYDHELEGLPVRTVDGVDVGTVANVIHLPANDLLAVRTDDGEVLVPFVREIVPTVTATEILIDPPEGLLDGTD